MANESKRPQAIRQLATYDMMLIDETSVWYEENASDFFDRTHDVDMRNIYRTFLRYIPEGGKILDAGCGSGRDTKAFHELGFDVTAMDGAKAVVELAKDFTGLEVLQMRFSDLKWDSEFDGVWTCASLLHVPSAEIDNVFSLFARALKPGGVWYLSFVRGTGERVSESGRRYVDFEPEALTERLQSYPDLLMKDVWFTRDRRPEEKRKFWTNAIVKREQ